MPEPIDRSDQAYLEASRAFDDAAGAARRREAVLAAVAKAVPAAANEPRWRPAAWWRGAAAACVLLGSALVVTRLADEPAVTAQAPPETALPVSEPAPAAAAPTPAPATAAPDRPLLRARRADGARDVALPAPKIEPAAKAAQAGQVELAQAESDVVAAAPAPPPALAAAAPGPAPAPATPPPPPAAAMSAMKRAESAIGLSGANRAPSRLQSPAADDERDADGRTALALAVLRGDVAAAQGLLARGADRLAKDRFGRTPQDYALAAGHPAMLKAFGLAAAADSTQR